MLEEFDICLKNNIIPIPVGVTGSVAKELWETVVNDLPSYYPDNNELYSKIRDLGEENLSINSLTDKIIETIDILQKV